jgi:uncharacterized surface protein with fasciclin (FAS1) repeats
MHARTTLPAAERMTAAGLNPMRQGPRISGQSRAMKHRRYCKGFAPMKLARTCTLVIAALAFTAIAQAGKNPIVGGKEMFPNKNIIENAVNSADHTTLVAAVKAAGLVETLQGAGPFTVFAPTNAAFAKLPAGTVDTLLKPENKPTLTKVLTYHVVPGKLSSMDLKKSIKKGNGTATLKTASGGTLWALMDGNDITLKDEKGDVARITQGNVFQSNGVIHVIDTVVLPQ